MSHRNVIHPQDEALARYIQSTFKAPMLSREEEQALGEALSRGGAEAKKARDRLVNTHLRMTVSMARKFLGYGLPLEDLIQEGSIGLIDAAERFEPGRGKFATYAWWYIRQAIRSYAIDNGRTIRVPVTQAKKITALNNKIKELTANFGRAPTDVEIASAMGIEIGDVHDLMLYSREPISLNMPIGDGESELAALIPDREAVNPEEALIRADEERHVREMVEKLPERERQVVTMRFGLDGEAERTLEEVSQVFDVSRERIRQIEVKALTRINPKRPTGKRRKRAG